MPRLTAPAATLVLVAVAGLAAAGTTKSFRQTTAKDFEEGEATASMVLPSGDVVPGMKTSRIPLEAAFVWCAALSPDGRTAYFGTGDQGRIFSIPLARLPEADSPAKRVADIDGAWVTSMVVKPDGTLIAGSTPAGRIFAINPTTGAVRSLAKVAAEHIWAMTLDPKSGTLYVAAGGPGKIFAVDAKGTTRLHWDAGDKHVVSLADAGGGVLLAGTSDQGIIYRVRPDGRAEALHDFDADEVRAIARAGSAIYVAVNDFDKPPQVGAAAGPVAARGTKIATGPPPPVVGGGPSRVGQVKSRGAVYRLEPDGRIEQVFVLPDGYFSALLVDGSGDVFAAAGTQGKLYRIRPDGTVALVADLPERQALALVRTADGFLVGTGDIGGVYRVRPATAGQATYLSKIFDAGVPARWGRLRWTGAETLAFETRSGNTAKPDRSWTEWGKLDAIARSGDQGEGRVASPPSRYLQYRAQLPGKSAILREATLFYLPQNLRARVTEVYLDPVVSTARAHSAVLRLRWRVENPDGDELIYRLFFRQEGEAVWRSLGGSDPITKPELDWNTESVPDGQYVIRVWASDEKVTPRDRALDSTFDSPPFLVDNGKPDVVGLLARSGMVTGQVRDAASVIQEIEYSIDGRDWRPASPTDLVLDQRTESFSVRLPPLSSGPHVITVRAYDAADNVGSARITVGK